MSRATDIIKMTEAVSKEEQAFADIRNEKGVKSDTNSSKRVQDVTLKYNGIELAKMTKTFKRDKLQDTSFLIYPKGQTFLKEVIHGSKSVKDWFMKTT